MERFIEALWSRPRGAELLVAGDFNVNLATPEGDRRAEDIATTLATEGLDDMSTHFLPRRLSWLWDRRMWSMIWAGREVMSRTYCIMRTDQRLFWNVLVRDPRNNSYHYIVLGCIRSAPLREQSTYLGGRKIPPLRPSRQRRMESSQPYGRLYQILRRGTRGKMRSSWRPCGNSSTRESLLARIVQSISPLSGCWAVQSQRS